MTDSFSPGGGIVPNVDALADPDAQGAEDDRYYMRISRLTVDKLGVKLYDKVSAAVAELVANAFDADAEHVRVSLPLNTTLARRHEDGSVEDLGYVIEVADDGHGMVPTEAKEQFLRVGRDRRRYADTRRSRDKERPVMGRKGIGKLAPFGICRRIEVVSAGGDPTNDGYLVSHFVLNYGDILEHDTEEPVPLESGPLDRTFSEVRGTTIRLTDFSSKRVPDRETFFRQLATRFTFVQPDFEVVVEDTRQPDLNPPEAVRSINLPKMAGTETDLDDRPVVLDSGEELPVTGWLAFARESYKHEELSGVRIYARGKIVATTRDFEQPAGFTGEFTARSYLVGEVHAEWLDLDEGEDLVRTDRQGIIWDSEYGQAFRRWGANLIKEIARRSAKPRRDSKGQRFLALSDIKARAAELFPDEDVQRVAIEFAEQIGGFAAEDELSDRDYVEDLTSVVLAVAPHKALMQAFQDFSARVVGGGVTIAQLQDLFGKTRVAEVASYGQIAAERVRVIDELERVIYGDSSEADLQRLIAGAPWLIEPTWTVISKNQALKTFKVAFERYYHARTGETVTLAIGFLGKRPDFTLVSVGRMLHIVEIKASGHAFADADFLRMYNYVDAFDEFFAANTELGSEFPLGYRIDLIADAVNITDSRNARLMDAFVRERKVVRISWNDFLTRTRTAHEQILSVREHLEETFGEE